MNNLKAAIIGYGGRGHAFERAIGETMGIEVVSIVEPKEGAMDATGLPEDMKFTHYDDFFARGKLADVVFITTMDHMHVDPAVKAIKTGYQYIVLEKPIAPTAEECVMLEKMAIENDVKILVCHSLRYMRHYLKLKEIIDSGVAGDIYNIHQTEGVGNFHFTHSFIRGGFGNTKKSTPMILQKCCHDIDLIAYLCNAKYTEVSSFGELSFFNSGHAPEAAAMRCIDCPVQDNCRFNAIKEYKKASHSGFLTAAMRGTDGERIYESFEDAMRNGRYGRCVYHCDNDAVDHQIVNFKLDSGATAQLTMTAFDSGRRTVIQGTKGRIMSNLWLNTIEFEDHYTGDVVTYRVDETKERDEITHNGADKQLVTELVDIIKNNKTPRTNISASVHSHLACFAAEASKNEGRTVHISEFEA